MSRFLKSLSSLMNGNADRSSKRDATEPDAGPSTLTTPLFPLNGSDADAPGTPQQPPRRHAAAGARNTSTEGAETTTPGALVPLAAPPASQKVGRKSASSRALNAAVRATAQVALSTHVEPTRRRRSLAPAADRAWYSRRPRSCACRSCRCSFSVSVSTSSIGGWRELGGVGGQRNLRGGRRPVERARRHRLAPDLLRRRRGGQPHRAPPAWSPWRPRSTCCVRRPQRAGAAVCGMAGASASLPFNGNSGVVSVNDRHRAQWRRV